MRRHPLLEALLPQLAAVSNRRRAQAEERLAALGGEIVPELAALAREHRNAYARAGALGALARIGGPRARAAHLAALRDPAMLVRLHALLRLRQRLWQPSVARAVTRLLRDPSGGVRINAVDVLMEHRVRSAVPALTRALRDDKWYVRQHAARALGALRAREARRELAGALDDPRRAVRDAAREACGRIDAPRTLGK